MGRSRFLLMGSVAVGLSLCVTAGVLLTHRDVKPANVIADAGSAQEPELDADPEPVIPVHTRVYAPRDAGARVDAGSRAKAAPAPEVETYVAIVLDDAGRPNLGACLQDADCKPKEACAVDSATKRFACLPAECRSDDDCAKDAQCRTVGSENAVLRCVPGGLRYEGERCSPRPMTAGEACQLGLICHAGRCGTPCEKGSATTCRAGNECVDSPDGPVCTPKSCKTIGCPGKETCAALSPTVSACMRGVAGEDCFAHPCAQGEVCTVRAVTGTLAYRCAKPCSPFDPASCAKGEVCGRSSNAGSVCYRACERMKDCGSRSMTCGTVSEDLNVKGCVAAYVEED